MQLLDSVYASGQVRWLGQASLHKGLKITCFMVACIAALLLLCVAPVAYADDDVASEGVAQTPKSSEPLGTTVASEGQASKPKLNSGGSSEPAGSGGSEAGVLDSADSGNGAVPIQGPLGLESGSNSEAVSSDNGDSGLQGAVSAGVADSDNAGLVDPNQDAANLNGSALNSAELSDSGQDAPGSDAANSGNANLGTAKAGGVSAGADAESSNSVKATVTSETSSLAKALPAEQEEPNNNNVANGQNASGQDDSGQVESSDGKTVPAYVLFDLMHGRLVFDRGTYTRNLFSFLNPVPVFTGFEDVAYESANEVPWWNLRWLITSVEFKDTIAPTSTSYWFDSCSNLQSFDAGGYLDMSRVTTARNMFSNCSSLKSVNMTGWDTSSLNDVSGMFDGCGSIERVDGLDKVMVSLAKKSASVTGFESLGGFAQNQLGMSQDDLTAGNGAAGEDPAGDATDGDGAVGVTPLPAEGSETATETPISVPVNIVANSASANAQQGTQLIDDTADAVNAEDGAVVAEEISAPVAAQVLVVVAPVASAAVAVSQRGGGNDVGAQGEFIGDDAVPMSGLGTNAGPAAGVLDSPLDSIAAVTVNAHTLLQLITDSAQASQLQMGVESALADLLRPDNPYAIIIAGISLVAAACFMLTFCLNLR